MTKHWESIVLGYVRPKAQSNRELTFTAFCLFDLQLDRSLQPLSADPSELFVLFSFQLQQKSEEGRMIHVSILLL